MRKRPVPDVVQQRRRPHRGHISRSYRLRSTKFKKNSCRKMKRPKAVRKPRVLRPLIRKMSKPELPDSPQSLKLTRIDQLGNKLAFSRVGLKPNDIVYRISIDAF